MHSRNPSALSVPDGVHIVTLPPYSSELNPIEKLWDLIQDQTANKLWPTIQRLDEVVALHLKDWWEAPEKVIRLFGKGWIRLSVTLKRKMGMCLERHGFLPINFVKIDVWF